MLQLRDKLLAALGSPITPGVVEEWAEGSKRLTVAVRPDGDAQVELHLPGRRGSPFEALFIIAEGSEEAAVDEICSFVGRVLDERTVLAMDGRTFRGGQRWLRPDQLSTLRNLEFAASWRGSFDRH